MSIFKKRVPVKTELIKTLTILDSETSKVIEIIDIIDEDDKIKEITLADENLDKYSETQLKDMSFMSTLRDMYPDMEDMETFLTDACKSKKLLKDEKNEQLTDEQKKVEQEKLDKIAESDAAAAKLLLDAANNVEKSKEERQKEIVDAEVARHAAAQTK